MRSVPDDVVSLLAEPEAWPSWVPGVEAVQVRDDDIRVTVMAAVPWELVVSATTTTDGVDIDLVRGPLPDLSVRLHLTGTLARCVLTFVPPAAVPAPLLRELEEVVMPRALASLDAATEARQAVVRGRSARSDG